MIAIARKDRTSYGRLVPTGPFTLRPLGEMEETRSRWGEFRSRTFATDSGWTFVVSGPDDAGDIQGPYFASAEGIDGAEQAAWIALVARHAAYYTPERVQAIGLAAMSIRSGD